MKSYQFSVGATPVTDTGTLNWSTNGTLGSLAIVDNLNTADTQTCTYGYDDISRVGSVGCTGTSAWSQTFSYVDNQGSNRFGNLSKSGSLTWQPGYDSATNRYTLAGTSYDNNGNLLNDTFHAYTWDAENKPLSIGTKTIIYDAFERVAETFYSSAYRQYLYTPLGFAGTMSGQTSSKIRIPLPGGATFTGGGVLSHADWLGSYRLGTNASTRTLNFSVAYAPFGEQYAISGSNNNNFSFASLMQDEGLGGSPDLNDAGFRELHPNQGRWISPDPAGLAAADPTNPQSWNRYAYVLNSPLDFTDPSGLRRRRQRHGNKAFGSSCSGTEFSDVCQPTWIDPFDLITYLWYEDSWWLDLTGFFAFANYYRQLPDGPNQAANNTTCSASPASGGAKQWVTAFADAAGMTAQFFSGLGADNLLFGPDTAESQMMASSPGVTNAVNSYLNSGQTSGLYTFGLSGLANAGLNPTQQFVGSFRWSITPGNGGLNLSLTNTTSFQSLTYDRGPQWQRGSWPTPMGNTHQTYNIFVPCK